MNHEALEVQAIQHYDGQVQPCTGCVERRSGVGHVSRVRVLLSQGGYDGQLWDQHDCEVWAPVFLRQYLPVGASQTALRLPHRRCPSPERSGIRALERFVYPVWETPCGGPGAVDPVELDRKLRGFLFEGRVPDR